MAVVRKRHRQSRAWGLHGVGCSLFITAAAVATTMWMVRGGGSSKIAFERIAACVRAACVRGLKQCFKVDVQSRGLRRSFAVACSGTIERKVCSTPIIYAAAICVSAGCLVARGSAFACRFTACQFPERLPGRGQPCGVHARDGDTTGHAWSDGTKGQRAVYLLLRDR